MQMCRETFKRKIGIMGGTFNPIHNGHLALAQAAYEHCCLDKVLFMPSGTLHGKERESIASAEHRLEMIKLAVQNIAHFDYSDMELYRGGYTYTVDTLRLLRERYPEDEFYYIMGADTLFRLPKWRCSKEIATLCTFVTVIRDDIEMEELSAQKALVESMLGAKVIIVPFRKVDISSSMVRKTISKGENTFDMIPEEVSEYIKNQGLYKENDCE